MAIIMLSVEREREQETLLQIQTNDSAAILVTFRGRRRRRNFLSCRRAAKEKGDTVRKAAPLFSFLFHCLSEAKKVTKATDSERKRNIHHHFAIAQKSGWSLLSYPQQNFTYLREGKDEREGGGELSKYLSASCAATRKVLLFRFPPRGETVEIRGGIRSYVDAMEEVEFRGGAKCPPLSSLRSR